MPSIKIPTPLRKYTNNDAEIKVSAQNVQEALIDLTRQYPDIKNHLLEEDHSLKGFVRLYIGSDDIEGKDGLLTSVNENDRINIIPAIAGGNLNTKES
jgi:molybdopterin converting factor small subunit